MTAFWASLPLLLVLVLMLWWRWSSARAGFAGLLVALVVAVAHFGLTWEVFWVSQVRALMLAFFVLYIIWLGLLTYSLVRAVGGINFVGSWLSARAGDRTAVGLLLAWVLSSMLEGIAGLGVPLAVVSPMLVAIGFDPVTAVAAVAIGHAWSVTFGDMGVVFEALVSVVRLDAASIAPAAAVILGFACIACGVATAIVLGLRNRWGHIVAAGAVMAIVQGLLAVVGLRPLAALGASVVGLGAGVWLFGGISRQEQDDSGSGMLLLLPYLVTTALLSLVTFLPGLARMLMSPATRIMLPEVATRVGWVTPAGEAKAIIWLTHPGTAMLLAILVSLPIYVRRLSFNQQMGRQAFRSAASIGVPVTLGVGAMVSLAMVMDHSGMTQELAVAISKAVGPAYPLLSGFIGMLGAFTTGSNTNSNVLFGPLQLQMSHLLNLNGIWLLAAQTAGGALGSMVAPAKLVVGCAMVGLAGQDGRVLRRTVPYGLLIALVAGAIVWLLA
ncbi:MAG: L-lactate permease [Anaerolineae bacterium]